MIYKHRSPQAFKEGHFFVGEQIIFVAIVLLKKGRRKELSCLQKKRVAFYWKMEEFSFFNVYFCGRFSTVLANKGILGRSVTTLTNQIVCGWSGMGEMVETLGR